MAWILSSRQKCSETEAKAALSSAQRVVKFDPNNSAYWQVLGWAYFRSRLYQNAIESLHKSIELQGDGGDPYQWFYLAMAHRMVEKGQSSLDGEPAKGGPQGLSTHREQSRDYFNKAVQWMEQKKGDAAELKNFRAEAEELLESAG